VTVITSGLKSTINCTCRFVMPPETGMTVMPNRWPPSCIPNPPVNSPYPYTLCSFIPGRAPAARTDLAARSAHTSRFSRV
jgi:hypothetical protein